MRCLVRLLLGSMVLLALLTWLPLHTWDDEAVVIQRGEGGQWVWQGEETSYLAVHIGGGQWDTSSVSSYSSADSLMGRAQPLHVSRIWIVALSSEPLARAVGRGLQERLLELPELEEVAYFPFTDLPLEVRRPPHLFVTVSVPRLGGRHLPGLHQLDLELEVAVGRRPLMSQWERHQEGAWPHVTLTQERQGQHVGLRTRAGRFEEVALEAWEALELPQRLRSLQEVVGTGHEPPLAWAGPPPAVPADLGLSALERGSWVAAMEPLPGVRWHTWRQPAPQGLYPDDQTSLQDVVRLRDQLVASGWELVHQDLDVNGQPKLAALALGRRRVSVHEHLSSGTRNVNSPQGDVVVQHQELPEPADFVAWLQGLPEDQRGPAWDWLQGVEPGYAAELRAQPGWPAWADAEQ